MGGRATVRWQPEGLDNEEREYWLPTTANVGYVARARDWYQRLDEHIVEHAKDHKGKGA